MDFLFQAQIHFSGSGRTHDGPHRIHPYTYTKMRVHHGAHTELFLSDFLLVYCRSGIEYATHKYTGGPSNETLN